MKCQKVQYFGKANGDEPTFKEFGALLHSDGGTLTIGKTTYRIQVIKKQQANEQQPQLDDTNREMEMVVSHWGGSRMLSEQAAGKIVEVVPPKEDYNWYLGKQGQPFYLRSCVQDMGSVILDRILYQQKPGPVLYVISGASGIGKSWFINAFMTELLRAKKKIFFHSGYDGRAWKISGVGGVEHGVAPGNITALDNEWVYVYDSPGSKETLEQKKNTARVRTGPGEVTLIFSSPKAQNYQFAFDTSNGDPRIMNLPTWKKEEMLTVKEKDAGAVDASYGIWGGNMRALDSFIARHTDDQENAKKLAVEELDALIEQIDEGFARKMARKLERQEVQRQFSGKAVNNSPGHILTPEPTNINPRESDCFKNFRWHFCSPLAEVKFWEHTKRMDHGVLKDLLISVFKTPSPKGVLFEKVVHILITNGVIQQFQCYPYKPKHQVRQIKFQECQKVISFETDKLQDELGRALLLLCDKAGAVALEPIETSFDAVDMFVLGKKEGTTETIEDWSLHMIQDTISKTHSFHPLKVLWYCSVFSKAFQEKFQNAKGDPLMCCNYVPVVPEKEKTFTFKKATGDLTWDELDGVEKLLGDFTWLPEFSSTTFKSKKPNWEAVVKNHSLVIPLNANGTKRQLNRRVVGNALLPETEKVEHMSQVIFNVDA
ncbi:expressed unknown protein [Seminavis robusta]|uniref:Uncharacterized protein n=1 Tax=Seminavis robusta TaxID=568900 RepID=A0A9N8EU00_9STRA|nr:expressed unknown protein [Seminavis robusta]|eukprot:Sro1759_g295790.1 n/a (657) ;mRNA; f:4844-7062